MIEFEHQFALRLLRKAFRVGWPVVALIVGVAAIPCIVSHAQGSESRDLAVQPAPVTELFGGSWPSRTAIPLNAIVVVKAHQKGKPEIEFARAGQPAGFVFSGDN